MLPNAVWRTIRGWVISNDFPFVSVVIPTLNEADTIRRCLASVGEDLGVEVVVSDGGSTDRTLEILAGRRGVRIVRGPAGRGQQLNRGADAARAPVLLFLHADCRLPAGWRAVIERELGDSRTVLACFRLRTESANGFPDSALRRLWLRLLDLRSWTPRLPYGDQGFALRRDTYERIGGFPEIPLMEDVVLARACRALGRIRRVPLEMRTSARRFERFPVRTRLMTATFPWLFRIGVPPAKLADWYRNVR
jgi:rSAM/selenodomain-associated transferase 2